MHFFELLRGTKKPVGPWKEDTGYIPQAGETYGFPMGKANGFWVLDLDVKGGVSGVESLNGLFPDGLPETYTVRTPSGGYHLYFQYPTDGQEIRNRQGILPGVDVRGEGGYVCAGAGYPPIDPATPVAPTPPELLEFVRAAPASAVSAPVTVVPSNDPARLASAELWLRVQPPCIAGKRGQDTLWVIAIELTRGFELSVADAFVLLGGYNDRCIPPWSPEELLHKLQDAASGKSNAGDRPPGWRAPSAAEFCGKEPVTVTAATAAAAMAAKDPSLPPDAWRQRADNTHAYEVDSSGLLGGSDKLFKKTQKEVTSKLCGPNAPPPWTGVWQYNAFTRKIVAINPPFKLNAETDVYTREDAYLMHLWYQSIGWDIQIEAIDRAVTVAANLAEFHPVRDYLNKLAKPALEDAKAYFRGIASRLWGAEGDRDIEESVYLELFAISAVRRVRHPGTKVDTMLVLAGSQGYHKSKFCKKLFDPWFQDQISDLGNKDASQALDGNWGIEFSEMSGHGRTSENDIKSFLSRSEDNYRPAYGRVPIKVGRQCVFIGTTNEDAILKDPSGSRRYMICRVDKLIGGNDFDFNRDEFWAAASVLEASGATHYLENKEHAHILAMKAESDALHSATDAWEGAVVTYLAKLAAAGIEWVTRDEIIEKAILVSHDKRDTTVCVRASNILRKVCGPSAPHRREGQVLRAYRTSKGSRK